MYLKQHWYLQLTCRHYSVVSQKSSPFFLHFSTVETGKSKDRYLPCVYRHTATLPDEFIYLCVCVCDTGVQTQGFMLLGRWPTSCTTLPTPFYVEYFLRCGLAFCLSWLLITILLISASQVVRITGMSHWLPDALFLVRKS
jgi:hypothetical protein